MKFKIVRAHDLVMAGGRSGRNRLLVAELNEQLKAGDAAEIPEGFNKSSVAITIRVMFPESGMIVRKTKDGKHYVIRQEGLRKAAGR